MARADAVPFTWRTVWEMGGEPPEWRVTPPGPGIRTASSRALPFVHHRAWGACTAATRDRVVGVWGCVYRGFVSCCLCASAPTRFKQPVPNQVSPPALRPALHPALRFILLSNCFALGAGGGVGVYRVRVAVIPGRATGAKSAHTQKWTPALLPIYHRVDNSHAQYHTSPRYTCARARKGSKPRRDANPRQPDV